MSDSCLSRTGKTHLMECMMVRASRLVSRCLRYDDALFERILGCNHNPRVGG